MTLILHVTYPNHNSQQLKWQEIQVCVSSSDKMILHCIVFNNTKNVKVSMSMAVSSRTRSKRIASEGGDGEVAGGKKAKTEAAGQREADEVAPSYTEPSHELTVDEGVEAIKLLLDTCQALEMEMKAENAALKAKVFNYLPQTSVYKIVCVI